MIVKKIILLHCHWENPRKGNNLRVYASVDEMKRNESVAKCCFRWFVCQCLTPRRSIVMPASDTARKEKKRIGRKNGMVFDDVFSPGHKFSHHYKSRVSRLSSWPLSNANRCLLAWTCRVKFYLATPGYTSLPANFASILCVCCSKPVGCHPQNG